MRRRVEKESVISLTTYCSVEYMTIHVNRSYTIREQPKSDVHLFANAKITKESVEHIFDVDSSRDATQF